MCWSSRGDNTKDKPALTYVPFSQPGFRRPPAPSSQECHLVCIQLHSFFTLSGAQRSELFSKTRAVVLKILPFAFRPLERAMLLQAHSLLSLPFRLFSSLRLLARRHIIEPSLDHEEFHARAHEKAGGVQCGRLIRLQRQSRGNGSVLCSALLAGVA